MRDVTDEVGTQDNRHHLGDFVLSSLWPLVGLHLRTKKIHLVNYLRDVVIQAEADPTFFEGGGDKGGLTIGQHPQSSSDYMRKTML